MNPSPETLTATNTAPLLLAWYDRHRRHLPWRAAPGTAANPYHVWLSEIMLQQTTVATVGAYFAKFIDQWPTVHDLAAAPEDAVLSAWAGLGYYARARNLIRCAKIVSHDLQGSFPQTEDELLELPGVGSYTAAAIAAIAFDRKAVVVDGNVERVTARLFNESTPLPRVKPQLKEYAARITPSTRPGDFAQAMMDLGATLCRVKKPACGLCPLSALCRARKAGTAGDLPKRQPRAAKPRRTGLAYVIERQHDGAVWLQRRPPKGLLGGMVEVPGPEWTAAPKDLAQKDQASKDLAPKDQPQKDSPAVYAHWQPLKGEVRHVFTHFELGVSVIKATFEAGGDPAQQPSLPANVIHNPGFWVLPDKLDEQALPTVMKKIIMHALKPRARL